MPACYHHAFPNDAFAGPGKRIIDASTRRFANYIFATQHARLETRGR